MNKKFINEYLNMIYQQVDPAIPAEQIPAQTQSLINENELMLTLDQLAQINAINNQIATERSCIKTDTTFFMELADRKPIILINDCGMSYALPRYTSGTFHGVNIPNKPWIPTISLYLQANRRAYTDMYRDIKTGQLKDVKNVFPIIYSPTYETQRFEVFGKNKDSNDLNDGYQIPEWIPDKYERALANSLLRYAYHLLGKIEILVNNNGQIKPVLLKKIWMVGPYSMNAYPEALKPGTNFSSKLIKDYGRYGFRESKIENARRKLITEKKKRLRVK